MPDRPENRWYFQPPQWNVEQYVVDGNLQDNFMDRLDAIIEKVKKGDVKVKAGIDAMKAKPKPPQEETVSMNDYIELKKSRDRYVDVYKDMKRRLIDLEGSYAKLAFEKQDFERANPLNVQVFTTRVNALLRKSKSHYVLPKTKTATELVKHFAELLWHMQKECDILPDPEGN